MPELTYFSLDPEAVEMLTKAGRLFGDRTLEGALARAIGTFAAIGPYAENGVLTVLRNPATDDDEDGDWVDIEIARPKVLAPS